MSAHSPAPVSPPRLVLAVIIFAVSIAAAFVFASAFDDIAQIPTVLDDPTLCGNPEALPAKESTAHASHGDQKHDKPLMYIGGLWSESQGLAGQLDAMMLAAKTAKPIVVQSALWSGEQLTVIDRSPIRLNAEDGEPSLILSVDYSGDISSIEYPGAAELQKYITEQKDKYTSVLIVEPLPGPTPDPDEDWTYLNFAGDDNIDFFTPKRNTPPAQVAASLYEELRDAPAAKDGRIADHLAELASDDRAKAADARLKLIDLGPYRVVAGMDKWVAEAERTARDSRVYEALMIRRAMGVHADTLIAEAAQSENTMLRALAARSLGDLADVTTNTIGLLTPLAEDDAMAVRYEALIATRAMPGRVFAGVAELVEPYEMSDAMRAVYQGTMTELLAFGEPIPADSRANRLRRLPITELLKENRTALVCAILLERTDLPDNQIDELLKQLAEANGQGPLTALLNTLQTMNPRTLAKRDVLLEKLVAWNTTELEAQTPRLKELAQGNGPSGLRKAAAAAMIMSSDVKGVFAELGSSTVPYDGLEMVKAQAVLDAWAEPIAIRIATQKAVPMQTTIAAIDAVRFLPTASITQAMRDDLLKIARGQEPIALRFAAIRAINALPADIKPNDIDDLTLTTIDILAIAGMKYDQESLSVTAGRPVELTLINPDTMEHNLVITKPGEAQGIGAAMSADPTAAAAMGYVPKDNPAVLHYTAMLRSGERYTLRFFAPSAPGSYEYVCTYPGHYTSMRGVLKVEAP